MDSKLKLQSQSSSRRTINVVAEDGDIVSMVTLVTTPSLPGVVEIHNEVYTWTPSSAKLSIIAFAEMCAILKSEGESKLIAVSTSISDWPMLKKYWLMVGFDDVDEYTLPDGVEVLFGTKEL